MSALARSRDWSDGARSAASTTLAVGAAALLLLGGVLLYVRSEIADADAFADRATAALESEDVRAAVAEVVVVDLIDRGTTDLVSVRPLAVSALSALADTRPFARFFRLAARDAHRLLFGRGGENAVLGLVDSGVLIVPALRSVAPEVADEVPTTIRPRVAELRRTSLATRIVRTAEDIRVLGIVLPILAALAFAAAVALAPDRRAVLTRFGVAVGVAGGLGVVILAGLRAELADWVASNGTLDDAEARGAVKDVWDAYFGDLRALLLGGAAAGVVLAAASSSIAQPADIRRYAAAALRFSTRESAPGGERATRGLVLVLLGVAVVVRPALALQALAVSAGALLVFLGTASLLSLVPRRRAEVEPRPRRSRRAAAIVVAGVFGLAAAGLAVALVASDDGGGQDGAPAQGPERARTCNGSSALCERRLNEVVFPATHNAMSAADEPGWLFANQVHGIPDQLDDGIRALLIDTHLGVRDSRGRVRTDLRAGRNRVAARLDREQLRAAERLVGPLGLGTLRGRREAFLCHSLCELGATPMADALRDVRRFLVERPGEVVILLVEDNITPEETEREFTRAGVVPFAAELKRDEPLPTLRELIESGRRLVVFAERDAGGVPWYHPAFSFIQDVPAGARSPAQFSCRRNRGTANSPVFALYHWLERFPPPLRANVRASQREPLLERVRRCGRERGLMPNLIAVDFYDRTDVVPVARELNREVALRARRAAGGGEGP